MVVVVIKAALLGWTASDYWKGIRDRGWWKGSVGVSGK
jgi:hypothetical protein